MIEPQTFNVVEPDGSERELSFLPFDTMLAVHVPSEHVRIDIQQLGELGGLFLAMAAERCDLDSIPELLEGYGATGEDFKLFEKALKRLLEHVKEYTE